MAATSIVWGFIISGSPQSERLRKFDNIRVNDLQNIQFKVVEYWQTKENLPSSLDALKNNIYGWTQPLDPQTGELYEYNITGETSFELCANFKTSDIDEHESTKISVPMQIYYENTMENWAHNQGYQCFSRTIDPDIFPPRKLQLIK